MGEPSTALRAGVCDVDAAWRLGLHVLAGVPAEVANDGMGAVCEWIGVRLGERGIYRTALDALDAMQPDDFKVGQDHLAPAFREVNFRSAFLHVVRTVNKVLHGTDEYGRPA